MLDPVQGPAFGDVRSGNQAACPFRAVLLATRFSIYTCRHTRVRLLRDHAVKDGSSETIGIIIFSLTRLILRYRQLDFNF